ncbi:MAG: class II fructose-bisphosphatase [Candidatus Krumholzibacteriota bacterium]|nr:class II fructose-bisphosphatase [Candidatus Krumholzibacteriota bacterium]
MERNLALEMVRVTEAAALAAARFLGKGDPEGADIAAVKAMQQAIKNVKMDGRVIIGEKPSADNAILYPGCRVGTDGELKVDIALDALDCRESLANGQTNSISAIAIGPKDTIIEYPSDFMKIIAVGREAIGSIDLNDSVFDNLVRVAESKRVYVEDLTVVVLERDRHKKIIDEVRRSGARIAILREGDLATSISTGIPASGIDVVMGIGSSAQGIIAAAALLCLGGGLQAQFIPPGEITPEKYDTFSIERKGRDGSKSGKEAKAEKNSKSGQDEHFEKIYDKTDLIQGDNIMFAATGVSLSPFLKGTIFKPGGALTHSVVLRSQSGTVRFLRTEHFFDKTPDYSK